MRSVNTRGIRTHIICKKKIFLEMGGWHTTDLPTCGILTRDFRPTNSKQLAMALE